MGVKPLLCNPRVPTSVSAGAVNLLTHLHARLEVLVKEEDVALSLANAGGHDSGDSPVLWESCWMPVLRAMADGVNDERHAVRVASVAALTHALCDRHALVVPAGVLVDLLGDTVAPTLLLLGQGLVRAAVFSSADATSNVVGSGNASGKGGRSSSESSRGTEQQPRIARAQTRDEEILVQVLGLSADEAEASSLPSPCLCDANSNGSGPTSGGPSVAKGTVSGRSSAGSTSLSRALQASAPVRGASGSAGELLEALCRGVQRQLKKLARYPSFDKLWLRLLHVLGFFLGAPHGFDHGVLQGKASAKSEALQGVAVANSWGPEAAVRELGAAVTAAGSLLTELQTALTQAGVFKTRAALAKISDETVAQFSSLPGARPHQ